jgi:hypothetical protein
MQGPLNEILTEETCSSGDKHASTRHLSELRAETIRNQIQIGLYNVFCSLH